MQEKLQATELKNNRPDYSVVTFYIDSQQKNLQGQWEWELQTDALYCSDVMSFPPDFEGTKSIIHPDDLAQVKEALSIVPDIVLSRLNFRIITTYGEVKSVKGKAVSLAKGEVLQSPEVQPWERAVQKMAARKEASFFKLRHHLADAAEKIFDTATWYYNKNTGDTWYSDAVFLLHGQQPQSLNAHLHTFQGFIHPEDKVVVADALEHAISAELPLHLEYRIVQPNGSGRYLRQILQRMFNEEGQVLMVGLITDHSDVDALRTEMDRAHEEMRQQRLVVQYAEKQVGAGYWLMNLVTRKVAFSENYSRIFGVRQPFVPSHKTFFSLVHPDDAALVEDAVDRMYREHVLPETEFRIIRPDGRQRHLHMSGKLATQNSNELMMMGIVLDITTRKANEESIRELVHKQTLQSGLAQLAEETAGMGSVVWFANDTMHWSDGFYRLLGYKPGSVEPSFRVWQKSIYPQELKMFNEGVAAALNNEPVESLQFRIISKAGIRHLKLTFRGMINGDQTALMGLVQDVTGSMGLKQQASASELYTALLENISRDLVLLTNTEHLIIRCNDGVGAKTGLEKGDVLHRNLFDVFPALKEETFFAQLQTALAGRETSSDKIRNSYLPRWHRYRLVPYKDDEGKVLGVLHVVQDISKHLELQQQLGERLAFIENLLDATVDRIVVLDHNMNYLYWNPVAENYYGLSKQQVLGKSILEVFSAFRNDPTYQEFRRVLKGETVHMPAGPIGDETGAYFETYLIPVQNDEGQVIAVLWIAHDLSRERQFQHQLQHSLAVLQQTEDLVQTGSWEYNYHSGAFTWSAGMYRMLNIPIGTEVQPHLYVELATEACKEAAARVVAQLTEGRQPFEETLHLVVNGAEKVVRIKASLIADEQGRPQKMIGVDLDITSIWQTEQKVRDTEHIVQQTTLMSPDAIMIYNLEAMQPRYLNGQLSQWTGYSQEQLLEMGFEGRIQLVHPNDRERLVQFNTELLQAGDTDIKMVDYRLCVAEKIIWVRNRSRVFSRNKAGAPVQLLTILQLLSNN